jgi:hypothetical protein
MRRAEVESLETRRLLAGDFNAGFALPYQLDFNRPKTGVLDRDGTGTGFTWVQPNRDGTELNTRKLDFKIGIGILRLYRIGTIWESANTLQNALSVRYAASSKPWVISARINGTLPQVDANGEEGGIFFGPDQDDFVKLVVTHNSSGSGLMFVDEQKFKTGYRHELSSNVTNIGSLNNVETLDLYLAGNPDTGTVQAYYRVNSGDVKQIAQTLTLTGDKKDAFFSPAGFAGVMAAQGAPDTGVDITFDQFGIKRGAFGPVSPPSPPPPSPPPPVSPPPPPPPSTGGVPSIAAHKYFNDPRGGSGVTIGTSIRNTGSGNLTITGLSITGTDASQFTVSSTKSLPATIAPGAALSIQLTYSAPSSAVLGLHTAALNITTNGKNKSVDLRALATAGTGGTNEPSLQRVMDLYQIPDNVGDTNPADVFIGDPPATPNDEISIQKLVKAGSGPVTITPLAVFGVNSDPTARLGYYNPGSPTSKVELFSIPTADAQTVNVSPDGATSFDPGSEEFAFYSDWPGFKDNGTTRTVFQEDVFNTFDAHQARHIRWYPMKNADGSVVANSYIMAHEDFPGGYDTNDIVAIVSNVQPAAGGAEIGVESLDEPPGSDRLVFNRFINSDPNHPDTTFHNQAKLRIRNSGSATLNISSMSVSGEYQIIAGGGAQSIASGKFADVTVKFVGDQSTSGVKTGVLTIDSNDASESVLRVAMEGYNQEQPESINEPQLATVVNDLFGYGIVIQGPGQHLTNNGKIEAVGDEILSPYWLRAGTSEPVTIRQISAFHTQDDDVLMRWFDKGTPATRHTIFTTVPADSQTLFPRKTSDSGPAFGSFTPTNNSTPFGFSIDNEYSDDSLNATVPNSGDQGHHVRFFRFTDSRGNAVPNTYLMVMDYQGVNFDYNDNNYVITNIRPAGASGGAVAQSLAMAPTMPVKTSLFASSPLSTQKPSDLVEQIAV